MRNRYFNADRVYGNELTGSLEYFCVNWQIKKFCQKNGLMKIYRKIYAVNPASLIQLLKEDYFFTIKDTNPLTCEGSRKGRVYFSWNGQIHYTEKPIMKFLIRLFFIQIYFY